jgi:hypothetical protein
VERVVGYAPLEKALDLATLPEAARREFRARLARNGLSPQTPNPIRALAAAELARAQKSDPRVTPADMQRAVSRSVAASALVPAPQSDLFGFTRLVDAKFSLDPATLEALVQGAIERPSHADEILSAVKNGPPDGDIVWRRPHTRAELAASLVRQVVMGQGASLQIQIDAPLAEWLEGILTARGGSISRAMGGAGAFAANLASALPNVESHFYSAAKLPAGVLERFSGTVGTIGDDGKAAPLASRSDASPARINYAAEYVGTGSFQLLGRKELVIEGKARPLAFSGTGRVILGTPASDEPGFGTLDAKALGTVARGHDLLFLVGAHYFTKGSAEETREKAGKLAADLRAMKAANPRLVRHHQYVVPKVAANEAHLMRALTGAMDSFSLNAVELPGLLGRLHAAGLSASAGTATEDRALLEHPATLLDGAMALSAAVESPRVHVHGMMGDLVIEGRSADPERVVLAMLRARQLACIKAANVGGEIKSAADLWPMAPVLDGDCLAAAQSFADALQKRFGFDDAERAVVAERWWWRAPDGRTYYFVPNRGIHDFTGGTISLGDTIDASGLIHSLEPGRGKKLAHPSSY